VESVPSLCFTRQEMGLDSSMKSITEVLRLRRRLLPCC
jgi:hypothetical protein